MYFGSVKFFKHLIIIIIVLLIVTSIALIVVLTLENGTPKYKTGGDQTQQTFEMLVTSGEPDSTTQTLPSDSQPITDEEPPPKTWPPEPTGEYSDLFPTMYAVNDFSGIDYTDDSKTIYLTFDDGPNNSTGTILEHLETFGVKATFFVIPSESGAADLRRIRDGGHAIGVHSYSHVYKEIYASVESFLEDFNKARELIYEQTGIWSDIFRFPGGSINNYNKEMRDDIIAEMERRGFVYFDWNVDSGDSNRATWDRMMNTVPDDVAKNTDAGERSIIIFHDAGYHTTMVIDDLIKEFQADPVGYTFGIIDKNVKPLQW